MPNAEWVLRQVPVISYFCENDGLYTMRWLNAGGGNDLGYDLQDFVNNKHYFAASAVHPDDLDVVDQFAERALASQRPIVARYRLVHVQGRVLPMILTARAVRDGDGQAYGFCGMVLDVSETPALQGPSKVLTDHGAPKEQPQTPLSPYPDKPDPAWINRHAPAATFAVETDESYTLRFAGGQSEFLLEYPPQDFLNNAKFRASMAVLPEDEEVADQTVEACAARPGRMVVSRYRLVHARGHAVPVLLACRGVPVEGRVLVAGIGLDLTHCPALHGKPAVLLK
ncbi:MAG: PAS domain-containing protein [Planctomycetes bacterium]|jgi:PAS domain S-box-containing protein|nr:PAS domain-containing protein [Planctomycetota bacterium]MCL4731587.1 PAS domain-containing protein [Planctomycetota bacterium]